MSDHNRDTDFQWYVIGRLKEFEGEQRANVLRLIAIAAFYSVELINQHGLNLGFLSMPQVTHVNDKTHMLITSLAVVWVVQCVAVHLCLRNQVFPSWLKFGSTCGDIILLSAVLMISDDGPRSPMVVAYFLIIALSTLRFSLPLIRCATVGSMVGYLFVNGFARWFVKGVETQVPRYHQLILLLGLALTGIVLGQVVRKVHAMARDYAKRTTTDVHTGENTEAPA